MKKYLIGILFAFVSVAGFTQVKSSDPGIVALKNCINSYLKLKKFSIDVEYSVFFDHIDFAKPDDKKSGKIIRENENFYQEEIGNIKIINKDFEFFFNEDAEVMSIRKRATEQLVPFQVGLDSLNTQISLVTKIPDGYQFTLKTGVIEKFDMVLAPNGFLKCMRNYYRDKIDFGDGPQKVVTQISYLNFIKNPEIDKRVFSLSEFITINSDGSATLTSKYKNYYLINNIQN